MSEEQLDAEFSDVEDFGEPERKYARTEVPNLADELMITKAIFEQKETSYMLKEMQKEDEIRKLNSTIEELKKDKKIAEREFSQALIENEKIEIQNFNLENSLENASETIIDQSIEIAALKYQLNAKNKTKHLEQCPITKENVCTCQSVFKLECGHFVSQKGHYEFVEKSEMYFDYHLRKVSDFSRLIAANIWGEEDFGNKSKEELEEHGVVTCPYKNCECAYRLVDLIKNEITN